MPTPTSPDDPGLKAWQRGDPIAAERLNRLQNRVLTDLSGGPGIRVLRKGNQAVVSLAPQDARPRAGFFPVALVVTAGQVIGTHGGDQTTAPTWTYTVNDYYTGDELATEQSPATGRRFGRFNSATLGDGYVKTDGTIGLWRADEGPGTTSC